MEGRRVEELDGVFIRFVWEVDREQPLLLVART